MKAHYWMVALLLCVPVVLFSRCLLPPVGEGNNVPEMQVQELAEQSAEVPGDYFILQAERRDLERLARVALELLLAENINQEKLVKLAQTQWEYDLCRYEVGADGLFLDDGLSLNSLETAEVGSNFVIGFGEGWSWFETEILPDDIMRLGAISGSYTDHLEIISPVSYEIAGTDGGTVHGEQYRFRNVPPGTEIKLVLTPELQTRIGHPSGTIVIRVRQ